jgi:hypothetical protein
VNKNLLGRDGLIALSRSMTTDLISDLAYERDQLKDRLQLLVVQILRMHWLEESFQGLSDPDDDSIQEFEKMKDELYEFASNLVGIRTAETDIKLERYLTSIKIEYFDGKEEPAKEEVEE